MTSGQGQNSNGLVGVLILVGAEIRFHLMLFIVVVVVECNPFSNSDQHDCSKLDVITSCYLLIRAVWLLYRDGDENPVLEYFTNRNVL